MPREIVNVANADLKIYPTPDAAHPLDAKTAITMGDLHGNALKLIWTLIRQNALTLNPVHPLTRPEDVYKKLLTIYEKPAEDLNKEDLKEFNSIIQAATVNKCAGVRIIGDELADRGSNDYFTLKLFEKLGTAGTPVEVMLSNHSAEFLDAYHNKTLSNILAAPPAGYLSENDSKSMLGLSNLLHRGLVEESDVELIVERYYKPNLKAISYSVDSLSKPPIITLYTHAPVGLETVEATAKYYNLPYDDSSLETLCKTIDAINENFHQEVSDRKSIHESHKILPEDIYPGQTAIPTTLPLLRLMWNRGTPDAREQSIETPHYGITLPVTQNHYEVRAVHGHEGASSTLFLMEAPFLPRPNGTSTQSYLPNMENTDNDLGKRSLDPANTHIILNTATVQFTPTRINKSLNVHLKEYPTPDKISPLDPKKPLTIVDLHGDPLKLMWTLMKQNVLTLNPSRPLKTSKDVYKKLLTIYEKPVEKRSPQDIQDFKTLIQAATVNTFAGIRIIGDKLDNADPKSNDSFTCNILDELSKKGIYIAQQNLDGSLGELWGSYKTVPYYDNVTVSPNPSQPVPEAIKNTFMKLQQTIDAETTKHYPTTEEGWHERYTNVQLEKMMVGYWNTHDADQEISPESTKAYNKAVKQEIFVTANLPKDLTAPGDTRQLPFDVYEKRVLEKQGETTEAGTAQTPSSLIAFSMQAADDSEGYKQRIETFKVDTQLKLKSAVLESPSGNRAAQAALKEIKHLIETTPWELGKWGSKSKILVNGTEKAIPNHAFKIYQRCLQGEKGSNAMKCLEEIRKISAEAVKPQSITLFKSFRERYQSTKEAYQMLHEASERLSDEVKSPPRSGPK